VYTFFVHTFRNQTVVSSINYISEVTSLEHSQVQIQRSKVIRFSSAEVKNAWSYTTTPQYVFMACCLVKHRDNFTFTFTFIKAYTQIRNTDLMAFRFPIEN
jgi:hypothetical protein